MVPRPPKRNEGRVFPISFGGRVPYAPRIGAGFGLSIASIRGVAQAEPRPCTDEPVAAIPQIP